MYQDIENGKQRPLTQREVAAMWLYHRGYARQGIGAIEFYKRLSQYEKNRVDDMIKEIEEAAQQAASQPEREHAKDCAVYVGMLGECDCGAE